jgi:hypothetical protein
VGTGELVRVGPDSGLDGDLPRGTVAVHSRLSVAVEKKIVTPTLPFTTVQLTRLDEALTVASRFTGLTFSVYLGDLGANTRATAEELHDGLDDATAPYTVVIAVSPGQRKIEIVTGASAARRISARICNLSINTMRSSFQEGDLIGGLVNGVRILCDQAGAAERA